MKKYVYVACVCLLVLSACKKNTTDDTAPTPIGFQWPAGTSDYAPYTNGSTFTFETSTGTPAVIDSFTYTVVKDTVIGGKTFRKLESNKPNLGPTYYSNFATNAITEISYNTTFQGFAIPPIAQIVLKDNEVINASWKDSVIVQVPINGFIIPVPVTFTNTILQKDITKNILAKDYVNTFEVKQIISIPQQFATAASLPTNSIQVNNFYAKGVGRIQRDATNGTVKIKRYNVIK
jgi:hypothetical protein